MEGYGTSDGSAINPFPPTSQIDGGARATPFRATPQGDGAPSSVAKVPRLGTSRSVAAFYPRLANMAP
eukprot:CAMPEP_0176313370 /NCGR_PEP_ID=MMETSP0121_2-20121125/67139_1 /TAXON_ID=160619 /ORGANISM="Kryptoperidinium foliaceum, Strain CCMP 1326" /LENGTH=67 /DNA_ID=CAMNT_0017655461 /DNA_START=214 /DNA_END=418 /DNA_ORIENTATION=-